MKAIDSDHYLIEAYLDRDSIKDPAVYPFNLPVVEHMSTIEFHPRVTFFVGENGSGKSTFLEALAVGMGLNPEGGSRNFHFSTRATHSELSDSLRLVKGIHRPKDGFFLRAESFYNVASEIDKLDEEPGGGAPIIHHYGGQSLHTMSHGESFIALLSNRFGGDGLYILDEPEAALSPARQFRMLALLKRLTDQGAQFIIATHSPILMGFPEADIHVISDGIMSLSAYQDTEHFKLTKYFLDNPEGMLREIFRNEDELDS